MTQQVRQEEKTMKKYLTGIILAVLVFTVVMPRQVFAAENSIQLEPTDKQVTVKLTLPNAAGEKISSLQLSLEITPCQSADFTFDSAVASKAVTYAQYHPNGAGGTLNIYISSANPLYQSGVETLSLGTAAIENTGNRVITVKAGNVGIVRGTKVEFLDEVSAETKISTNSEIFPTVPGGNVIGTATPEPSETPEPTETPEVTETPEPPVSETPAVTPTPDSNGKLKTPKVPKLANLKSGIRITWTKVPNASGYYVYRKTVNGTWKKIATVKGNKKVTYTDKAVKNKNGVRYFYSIQAYNGKNTSAYNKTGTQSVRMISQSFSKPISKGSRTVLVKWKRNKKAAGYQIEYSTSKQWKNSKIARIRSGKKTSKTLKGLKRGKTYYFRVRSYQKVGKTTYASAWSAKKKVKVK